MRFSSQVNFPSPLDVIDNNFRGSGIALYMKRDDLIHPWVNGNKYRKLSCNIKHFYDNGFAGICSFGGAFSNHLIALAYITHVECIPFVAFVRAYEYDHNNPILKKISSWGTKIIIVPPDQYHLKEQGEIPQSFLKEHNNYYLIPEGGTNDLALKGAAQIIKEIYSQTDTDKYSKVVCTVGTGGTSAGIYANMNSTENLMLACPFKSNLSYLRGFELIKRDIPIDTINVSNHKKFGAYDPDIVSFINRFYNDYQVLLDPIYTAKTMYWLANNLDHVHLNDIQKIIFIHTGGLPGIIGYNYLYRNKETIRIPLKYDHLQSPDMTFG